MRPDLYVILFSSFVVIRTGFGFAADADDYTCRFNTDLMICPMLPGARLIVRDEIAVIINCYYFG